MQPNNNTTNPNNTTEAPKRSSVEEILDQEHAYAPDMETLYTADGNVYAVGWDYYGEEGNPTDLILISDYKGAKDGK